MIRSTKPWIWLPGTCSHFLLRCSGQPSRMSAMACTSCCELTRHWTHSCSTSLRQHPTPIAWHQDHISSQCRSDEYIQNMSWLFLKKEKQDWGGRWNSCSRMSILNFLQALVSLNWQSDGLACPLRPEQKHFSECCFAASKWLGGVLCELVVQCALNSVE